MSYTLAELTTELTADEVETAIYSAIEARGAKTTSWKPGAVVRTIIAGVSIVLAAFSRLSALVASGGFLELATESWLTLVAQYVFGVTRTSATFATGEVTLTNTSATPYSGGAGDLIVQNSTTGAVYRSTGAWSVGVAGSPTEEVDVAIKAVESGSDSTSPAGDIDALVTTLSGVSVSNAAAVVGTDEEEDAALRARCIERTGALSPNGPADAYRYVSKNAVDSSGDSIGVTRVSTQAVGDGSLNVWVASATGEISGTAGNPDTDLGAIAADIYEQAEPLGIEAVVASATAVTVNVTYELWIYSSCGLSSSQVEDLVEDAISDLFASTPIGGHVIGSDRRVYTEDIISAIDSVRPEIFRCNMSSPAVDVVLDIDEIPVVGNVTGTVNLMSGGDL